MHLSPVSSEQAFQAMRPTHELSVTERMRGARSDDLFMELWEPFEVVEAKPFVGVSIAPEPVPTVPTFML